MGMEWFKMRCVWGTGVALLSDTEAGRFIKAVYRFINNLDEYDGHGKEEPIVSIALETLRSERDEYLTAEAVKAAKKERRSEINRQNAAKRWDKQKCESMQTDANRSEECEAASFVQDACASHKFASQNKNIETDKESESESEPEDLCMKNDSAGRLEEGWDKGGAGGMEPLTATLPASQPETGLHADKEDVALIDGSSFAEASAENDRIHQKAIEIVEGINDGYAEPTKLRLAERLIADYGEEMVDKAMEIAAQKGKGKTSLAYLEGILKRERSGKKDNVVYGKNGLVFYKTDDGGIPWESL